jgi:hypothetical protein
MKVLATNTARLVVLKPTEELAPDRGMATTELPQLLIERYGFKQSTPLSTPIEKIHKEGFKYFLGQVSTANGVEPVHALEVYNDGVVITAKSTDVAEVFLIDLVTWLVQVHGFRIDDESLRRRLYASEVTVQFSKNANTLLKKFEQVSDALTSTYKSLYPGLERKIEMNALTFDFDRSKAPSGIGAVGAFKFERQVNEPYSENRFFCIAPLRTADHLAILQTLETLAE